MSLKKRLHKLESYSPEQRRIEDLSDDELAEFITGTPGTKSDDITDGYLQAIAKGEKPALLQKIH